MNRIEKPRIERIRPLIIALVAFLHIMLLLLAAFNLEAPPAQQEEAPGVMRLINVEEELPPPPEPEQIRTNTLDAIAQNMIETDTEPPPVVLNYSEVPAPVQEEQLEYLPQGRITVLPVLPEDQIARAVVYPPIAQRSNIEGSVFLELFIDPQGNIRDIRILREDPPNRGFGEAALNAFRGIRALRPAEADGVPAAVRFRYNLRFRLR